MKLSLLICGFVCAATAAATGAVVQGGPSTIQDFYGYDNDVALFIENRPKGCEDGFWVRHSDPQYSENLRAITAAAHAGAKIVVKAFDDQTWSLFQGKVCRVQSVAMERSASETAEASAASPTESANPTALCQGAFRVVFPSPDKLNTPGNTAVIGSNDEQNRHPPLKGRTSYTEKEARARIESEGFTDIGPLTLEDKSIWRTRAMRDGCWYGIMLDYRGNIVGQSPP